MLFSSSIRSDKNNYIRTLAEKIGSSVVKIKLKINYLINFNLIFKLIDIEGRKSIIDLGHLTRKIRTKRENSIQKYSKQY